jgi:pimeloyl-ACP methyl ester carboxylesterase
VTPLPEELAPYPGAVAPQRQYRVDVGGLGLAIHEWGDADAPPLMLAHGGMDFARTHETFAPLLAAGGWRVVSWDQRGHGDSDRAHLYSWESDLRDASAVFEHIGGRRALPAIGHSKGGALLINLADAEPFRFRSLVNIDGIPSKRPTPDVAEHERTKLLAADLKGWLDHRRRTAGSSRAPGTIDELAERRRRMNPRLPIEWLRHLVTTGATESADGWRWKVDPSMRFGGFGPWRPEWALNRLAGISVPFLGILADVDEPVGWSTDPDDVRPYLPQGAQLEVFEGVGHFLHIERPAETAARVLDFLGTPS